MSHSGSTKSRVILRSIGHHLPAHHLPNSFFDALQIGSEAGWIEERTGIKARRSVLSSAAVAMLRHGDVTREALAAGDHISSVSDLMLPAWQMALARLKIDAPSIDVVIGGTSIPDSDIPAHACTMAKHLGIGSCAAFDVNSACSTFVVQLHVARSMLLSNTAKRCAVLCPERYSTRLDFSDRKSAILFGDGAAAAIVEMSDGSSGGLEVLDTFCSSQPEGENLIRIPEGGLFNQNGKAVQKFAVTKTRDTLLELLQRNDLKVSDLSYFIGHQANLRMLQSVVEKIGLEPAKHLFNVDHCGNQGGAGAPIVLSTHWDHIKRGDLIAVVVVGSGLTWAGCLLKAV